MVKKRDIDVIDENIQLPEGSEPVKAARKRASAKKAADHVGLAKPVVATEVLATQGVDPPRGRPTTSLLFQAPDLPPLPERSAPARSARLDPETFESPTVRRRSRRRRSRGRRSRKFTQSRGT